jgi:DNA polymerase III delta prime subunit
VQKLQEMILLPMLYPEEFNKFKIQPPRGVIFHGPPGTGKTLVARVLAAEASKNGQKVIYFAIISCVFFCCCYFFHRSTVQVFILKLCYFPERHELQLNNLKSSLQNLKEFKKLEAKNMLATVEDCGRIFSRVSQRLFFDKKWY